MWHGRAEAATSTLRPVSDLIHCSQVTNMNLVRTESARGRNRFVPLLGQVYVSVGRTLGQDVPPLEGLYRLLSR